MIRKWPYRGTSTSQSAGGTFQGAYVAFSGDHPLGASVTAEEALVLLGSNL